MASTPPKTEAYGYLRVSGKTQLLGDGFPRQRKAIEHYAATNNLRVVEFFEEKAVSGKTDSDKRPAWIEMLKKIASDSVRTIVIERLDRLARDLGVQEHIIKEVQKLGINLISVAEPDLCETDPTRVLIRQMLGAIAQYDRSTLVIKLKVARDRKRYAGGHAEGPARYGSHPKHPEEAAIRDRVRKMRLSKPKPTLQTICDTLNAEGVPTRHGKLWVPTMVWRIARRKAA